MTVLLEQPVTLEPELLDLEREWSAFFRGLNECRRSHLHEVEEELHDLFVAGDVSLAEVRRYLRSLEEGEA